MKLGGSHLPMPRIDARGAAVAPEGESCTWWPTGRVGMKDEPAVVNGAWRDAALDMLVAFTRPDETLNASTARHPHAHVSAALRQVRDDRVVWDSLPQVDTKMREGLELLHRDVLAAVAVVSALDFGTDKGRVFRAGTLEPADKPKAKAD